MITIYSFTGDLVDAGRFMNYVPSFRNRLWTCRILRWHDYEEAKPADLPVEQNSSW
jgi:hypothetical protein